LRYVFDTEVLLRFYLEEPGSEKVLELFNAVMEKKADGYISVVNLTELYYILYRKDPKIAEEKTRNLISFGLVPYGCSPGELWKLAAQFKAQKGIPLADAFAAATAKHLKAALVTGGDRHFEGFKIELLKI